MNNSHALVIGGTGMLKSVSAFLLYRYKVVSVIARSKLRFYSLQRETEALPGVLNPIVTDYSDAAGSLVLMNESVERFGAIELCVSWVHGHSDGFGIEVAKLISNKTNPVFIDVVGSSGSNLKTYLSERIKKFSNITGIDYRFVVLGKIVTSKIDWRWLTDEEISKGVITAIESESKENIVGEI